MKKVLITGAGGLLGSHIVEKLKNSDRWHVVAASRNPLQTDAQNVTSVTNDEIFAGTADLSDVNAVIHCAFSRDNSPQALAEGLIFTKNIFDCFKCNGLDNIINVSSQGLYKQPGQTEFLKESAPIAPRDAYGVTKLATELLMDSIFGENTNYTNVRLSSLNMPQRFTQYFVNNALNGTPVKIMGGKQKVSLMDARDAANGLIALIDSLPAKWQKAYNLGTGRHTTVEQLALLTADIVHKKFGYAYPVLEYAEREVAEYSPVDISAICADTGWSPSCDDEAMITDMIERTLRDRA